MAINWMQRLNQNLGQEGLGNALGLLGMALMRGGARSTDPGAMGKGLAQGFGGFAGAMQDARNTAFQRKYQTAQLTGLEAQNAERERLAKLRERQRGLLGTPATPEMPGMQEHDFPRQFAGAQPGTGMMAGETEPQRIAALQAMEPRAAAKFLLGEQSLKGHKTIKGGDGFNYWVTGPQAGERVLPGVKKTPGARPKPIKEGNIWYWPDTGDRVLPNVEAAGTDADFDPREITSPWQVQFPDNKDGTPGDIVPVAYDKRKDEWFYRDKAGKRQIAPYGMVKTTPSSLQFQTMKPAAFMKLAGDMQAARSNVIKVKAYMDGVAESDHGLKFTVTKAVGKFKTFFGGQPTMEQIVAMDSDGRLNALIGQFRLEVVGGGVMTEQDAKRIIYALGGDADASRHPEIVRRLLGEIVQAKVDNYNNVWLPTYNAQAERVKTYKPVKPLKMPAVFLKELRSGLPAPYDPLNIRG